MSGYWPRHTTSAPLFFRLFPAPKPVLSLSKGLGAGKKGWGLIFSLYIEKTTKGYKKIILYANPGKERFYSKLGFKKMKTAMAIFQNDAEMINNGVLTET